MARVELAAFVAAHAAKRWQPGQVDCLLTLADWFVWRGFPDAAAHLRGAYHDEAGFQKLIDDAGGAVPLVGGCARSIRLSLVDVPCVGSIGVIGSTSNRARQFGAIYGGVKWLLRGDEGFLPMTAKPLAIWDAV